MLIREIEDADLLDRLGKSSGPRSEGLHLSTIIKSLMTRLQPKRFGKLDPNEWTVKEKTKVEIGLLFENVLEQALREKFATVRPSEVFSDEGIAMSPDGINPTDMALEEYKATFMSSRDGIFEVVEMEGEQYQVWREKFVHWKYQILGYAKWLGVRKAILRVLWICGDYSKPIQPKFTSYELTFTDEEVEQNWATLMTIAREEGHL